METTTETSVVEGIYENAWTFKGTTFTSDDINDFFGFVYCITNLQTGRKYIGRNTSYRNESLEVVKGKDGLRLKVTGKSTTEVLTNLKETLRSLEKESLNERS